MKNKRLQFIKALQLVLENTKLIPLVRQAQITAWNLSLETCPYKVAKCWNFVLPRQLRISEDSFVDKGDTPEWLNDQEKRLIAEHMGLQLDPMEAGFHPFWMWHFPNPERSLVQTEKQKALMHKEQDQTNHWGYGNSRYHGD